MDEDKPFMILGRLEDASRGTAGDVASALEDPYTVLTDRKSGDHLVVYDERRYAGGGDDGE